MKKNLIILLLISSVMMLSGCAENQHVTQCLQGHQYGFFGGVLHGFIAPFALIGCIFTDNITVFALNNNGGWYAFGFLIGFGFISGSSTTVTVRKKK